MWDGYVLYLALVLISGRCGLDLGRTCHRCLSYACMHERLHVVLQPGGKQAPGHLINAERASWASKLWPNGPSLFYPIRAPAYCQLCPIFALRTYTLVFSCRCRSLSGIARFFLVEGWAVCGRWVSNAIPSVVQQVPLVWLILQNHKAVAKRTLHILV